MKTIIAKLSFILVLLWFGCEQHLNTTSYKSAKNSYIISRSQIHALSEKLAAGKPLLTINPPRDLISYRSSGNKLTPEMLAAIEKATPGTKVYFEDIKAVGPDGKTRYLNSICLTLK
jgi:hypothetical protein